MRWRGAILSLFAGAALAGCAPYDPSSGWEPKVIQTAAPAISIVEQDLIFKAAREEILRYNFPDESKLIKLLDDNPTHTIWIKRTSISRNLEWLDYKVVRGEALLGYITFLGRENNQPSRQSLLNRLEY